MSNIIRRLLSFLNTSAKCAPLVHEPLKPCPFCGAPVSLVSDPGSTLVFIACPDKSATCHSSGLASVFRLEDLAAAVRQWNTRAQLSDERIEFAQILRGLKARGIITEADIARLDASGTRPPENAQDRAGRADGSGPIMIRPSPVL